LKETAVSYLVEIERKVMDAGAFEGMKAGLKEVNEAMKTWLAQNEGLLQQKVPEYTRQVIESVKGLIETTSGLIGIYHSIPEEIVGAAGYGIIGRIVFGGWGPARIVAGIALINNTLSDYGMGLGDLKRKNDEAGKAILDFGQSLYEVISGQRNWHTGEWTEWTRAADAATDYWQRQKKGIADYQADIRRIIENDPLNDFFARNRSQMGYYTSPAGKIIRQMAKDQAQAAEEAKASAKKLAAELKKAQEDLETALMTPSRIEEAMAGGQHENALMRMETERIERIREDAKKVYAEIGLDVHQRHREMIGPYDAEQVKKNLEEIKNQEKESSDWMIELNKYTLETIQDQFATFFDDLQEGEFKSFGDYVLGFFKSLGKAVNRIVAQWFTEELFGKAGGSGGMFGELLSWGKSGLSGLLGSFGGGSAETPSGWVNPWTHHAGGIAGNGAAPTRMVPAAAFAGAPRFHSGLAPDEVAAILKRDEGIFTPAQMKALGGRSLSISVPVSIPAGSGFDERRLASRLRDETEVVVRRVLAEEMR
jgi:polyhydroxyalkanoate synthesis regulator phasin